MELCGEQLGVETNSVLWQKILSVGTARTVTIFAPMRAKDCFSCRQLGDSIPSSVTHTEHH